YSRTTLQGSPPPCPCLHPPTAPPPPRQISFFAPVELTLLYARYTPASLLHERLIIAHTSSPSNPLLQFISGKHQKLAGSNRMPHPLATQACVKGLRSPQFHCIAHKVRLSCADTMERRLHANTY